jgi:hypothetical protein
MQFILYSLFSHAWWMTDKYNFLFNCPNNINKTSQSVASSLKLFTKYHYYAQIRIMRWAWYLAPRGEKKRVQNVGKPESKRASVRLRFWKEENIKVDLRESGFEVCTVTQDTDHGQALVNIRIFVNTVTNFSGSIKARDFFPDWVTCLLKENCKFLIFLGVKLLPPSCHLFLLRL